MKLIENTDGLDIDIISGKFDDDFSDLVFNTKNVVKDCLFVCIKGRNFDTHNVIDEIVKLGAKAVVVERNIKRDDSVTSHLFLCALNEPKKNRPALNYTKTAVLK